MKRTLLFLQILSTIIFIGCRESRSISDVKLYGNTFIHVSDNDFIAPDNWIMHNLFDNAFQIKLPPYMHETESYPMRDGCASTIFMYRDTTETHEYHYGRIGIDYYYHDFGDFNKADEYISHSDQEKALAPVVNRALSGGQKISDYTVPDGELLNGPFYDSHHMYDNKFFYAYDAYYRRKGHTQGEGPVSCHIFLLMNKMEAALMTVSFHDKDSVLFENLFNIVKTFKWAKYNE